MDESREQTLAYWHKIRPQAPSACHEIATDLTLHCLQVVPGAWRGPRRSSWTNIEWQPPQVKRPVALAAIDVKENWVRLDFWLPTDFASQCRKEGLVTIDAQPRRGGRWVYSQVPKSLTLEKAKELLNRSFEVEFGLVMAAGSPPIDVEAQDWSDEELEKAFREGRLRFPDGEVETSTATAASRRRRGQDKLRELTLKNYGSTCALCDVRDTNLLRTSHIIGWSERADTRGFLKNAVCLCSFHDALFENGYWSLSDDLGVVLRSAIESATIEALLPTTCSFRRPTSHPPAPEYVRHHRTRHGL